MSSKVIIGIFNPGESPADNGRTVHALKLAGSLIEAGAEVKVLFEGKGTTWIPRFVNRTDDSHPFVKHYGATFDAVRDHVATCSMCTIRFDTREACEAAGIPILAEGRHHVDLTPWILEGWQVINY